MLERMEKEDLLRREPWSEDRRIIRVSLTKNGKNTLKKAHTVGASIYQAATDGIADEDIQHFMGILKKIRSNLHRNPHVTEAPE